MPSGVVLCAFGEPATPDRTEVVTYLERIFRQNAQLESPATEAEARDRARQLADRRAPGLLEDYKSIGGSPLNAQAADHASAVQADLADRGHSVETYVGYQFTDPAIEDVIEMAQGDGVDHLVGIPLYPLCGPSTTVASLDRLRGAVEATPDMALDEVSGWHRHPDYVRVRADAVQSYASKHGINLTDPTAMLVCSAHGTPLSYLEGGSRYRAYVEEYCEVLATHLGVDEYALGYQNHEHRDIPWTEPAIEEVIADIEAEQVVVEPVSFLHEQSETLVELDRDLRKAAAAHGLAFHRVPIPHDDPRIAGLLADLAEPFLGGNDPRGAGLNPCQCRVHPRTVCLNAPPSEAR